MLGAYISLIRTDSAATLNLDYGGLIYDCIVRAVLSIGSASSVYNEYINWWARQDMAKDWARFVTKWYCTATEGKPAQMRWDLPNATDAPKRFHSDTTPYNETTNGQLEWQQYPSDDKSFFSWQNRNHHSFTHDCCQRRAYMSRYVISRIPC